MYNFNDLSAITPLLATLAHIFIKDKRFLKSLNNIKLFLIKNLTENKELNLFLYIL